MTAPTNLQPQSTSRDGQVSGCSETSSHRVSLKAVHTCASKGMPRKTHPFGGSKHTARVCEFPPERDAYKSYLARCQHQAFGQNEPLLVSSWPHPHLICKCFSAVHLCARVNGLVPIAAEGLEISPFSCQSWPCRLL